MKRISEIIGDYNYTVDSGLPISVAGSQGPKGNAKYPWECMKEGDSFFVPIPAQANSRVVRKRLGATVCHCGRTWLLRNRVHGLRVSQRQRTEGGVRGIRFWLLSSAPDGGMTPVPIPTQDDSLSEEKGLDQPSRWKGPPPFRKSGFSE